MKKRLEVLLAEYGAVALTIYLVIFGLTMAGFVAAIGAGFAVEGVAGSTGTLGAAWLATKLTQPLRIGATVILTPIAAGILRRVRREPARLSTPAPAPAVAEPSAGSAGAPPGVGVEPVE